jgi:PAS domain S-box-containing protein
MAKGDKTRAELLRQLEDARKRIADLERAEGIRELAEEALHEAERLYREVYNIAPLAFVIWDRHCRVTDWNQRAEEIFGWTREEVLGRNFFEFLIPLEAQIEVETVVNALLQKELPNRSINENLTKSGNIILCEWNNSIRYDSTGGVVGAISLGLDITERRQADEEIRRARDDWSNIFGSISDPAVILGRDHRIIEANRAAIAAIRRPKEEIIGRHCYTIFHCSDHPPASCPHEQLLRSERPETVEMEIEAFDGIYLVSVSPVLDGERRVVKTIHIAKDVTEHKRIQENLRDEKERAQRYFEIAGVILVVIDVDRKVSLINKKGCEVLGYKEEEIIGKDWFDHFVPERLRRETKDVFQKLLAGEIEPVEYHENPILTKSGDERIIAWHNTVLIDDRGRIIGTLSSGEDITDRKRAEDALRRANEQLESKVKERTEQLRNRNEEMERFIYSVSHDLKNPLRVIERLSQTLINDLEQQLARDQFEDLSALSRMAESTNHLLEDMLTYARLGIESFSKTELPLKTVIVDAQLALIAEIGRRGAEIRISEPMPIIRGHHRTLTRLMVNLLSNAMKFVPVERSPEIYVDATVLEHCVRVSVRDNGIGIDPGSRERIFRMFERLHSQDRYAGTGIGLAIAKKAVELHDGRIGVESEPGTGSTFWFEIPS